VGVGYESAVGAVHLTLRELAGQSGRRALKRQVAAASSVSLSTGWPK
jgi:hypothetical protein